MLSVESIDQLVTNPKAQMGMGAASLTDPVANSISKTQAIQEITQAHWYDKYWDPIWNLLPWTELATVMGVIGLGYGGFVFLKNAIKSKIQESHLQNKLK